MEATSLLLVALELLLALVGCILFLYPPLFKGGLLSKADFSLLLLAVVSSLWFVLADSEGRLLGFKAALFLSCLYFTFKYPRQGALLVVGLAVFRFLVVLDADGLGAKNVVCPLTVIVGGLLLLRHCEQINMRLIYVAVGLEAINAILVVERGFILSSLLAALILLSIKWSRLFIKFGRWLPLAYLVVVVISYYALLLSAAWMPVSASNFERSSMILAGVEHFFEYLLTGPKEGFDAFVDENIGVFNYSHYEVEKGIDPHSFLLSIWRDEGVIITMLWLGAWFYYWNKLVNFWLSQLNEKKVRIALAMLAYGVVQFCLSPPETGTRLIVSLILGTVLGFANMCPSVNANPLCYKSGRVNTVMSKESK